MLKATPAQGQILLNHRLQPVLRALMRAPLTVSQLAEEAGLKFKQVHDIVRKLELHGIAQVDHAIARRGSSMKVWRVNAPWFIPFEHTAAADLEQALVTLLDPPMHRFVALVAAKLRQDHVWGLSIDQNATQFITSDLKSLPEIPAILFAHWFELRLSAHGAEQLRGRILELLDLEPKEGDELQPYTLGLFLAEGRT